MDIFKSFGMTSERMKEHLVEKLDQAMFHAWNEGLDSEEAIEWRNSLITWMGQAIDAAAEATGD